MLIKGIKSPRKKNVFFCEFCLISRIILVSVLLSASVERRFVSRMRDFFYIGNFSKLLLVSVSEFGHQNIFEWNELFARPDTLSFPFLLYFVTILLNQLLHRSFLPELYRPGFLIWRRRRHLDSQLCHSILVIFVSLLRAIFGRDTGT